MTAFSIIATTLVALGCHGRIARSAGVERYVSSPVPAVPPDSVPSDLSDSTKWVSGEPHYAGTILRDILILSFRPGTSQADRQAAVDLVHGVVVGGRRFGRAGGLYFIRVPTDGTLDPLFKAIDALTALPQVSTAMPDEILFFDQRG